MKKETVYLFLFLAVIAVAIGYVIKLIKDYQTTINATKA
jgi:hypothetical protein